MRHVSNLVAKFYDITNEYDFVLLILVMILL